jgi:hypothetical protein
MLAVSKAESNTRKAREKHKPTDMYTSQEMLQDHSRELEEAHMRTTKSSRWRRVGRARSQEAKPAACARHAGPITGAFAVADERGAPRRRLCREEDGVYCGVWTRRHMADGFHGHFATLAPHLCSPTRHLSVADSSMERHLSLCTVSVAPHPPWPFQATRRPKQSA